MSMKRILIIGCMVFGFSSCSAFDALDGTAIGVSVFTALYQLKETYDDYQREMNLDGKEEDESSDAKSGRMGQALKDARFWKLFAKRWVDNLTFQKNHEDDKRLLSSIATYGSLALVGRSVGTRVFGRKRS